MVTYFSKHRFANFLKTLKHYFMGLSSKLSYNLSQTDTKMGVGLRTFLAFSRIFEFFSHKKTLYGSIKFYCFCNFS